MSQSRKRPRCHPSWYLFSTDCVLALNNGAPVICQTKSNPTILSQGTLISRNSIKGKAQIRCVNGDSLSISAKDFQNKTQMVYGNALVLTHDTVDFRRLVSQLLKDDVCLEIGCSTGETSEMIIPLVRSWVGIDTSEEMVAACMRFSKKYGSERCHVCRIDALVDPRQAIVEGCRLGDPTCIFVDIGGNRECLSVLQMLSWVLRYFDPRLIVVKSEKLVETIQQSCSIDGVGLVKDANSWFAMNEPKRTLPKHPLRAPMVYCPDRPDLPICRYHNYHKDGCNYKEDCRFDHTRCHGCLALGHTALECEHFA